MPTRLATAVLGTLLATAVGAAPPPGDAAARAALRAATVMLDPVGCAGVVVEDASLVVTARHCVDDLQSLRVRFPDGPSRRAWVVAADRAADQAILLLEDPLAVTPLSLAARTRAPGAVLYFSGHPRRPRFQEARLERVGRCSSLPHLPDALFTSVDGTPGDSGAPVVDAAGRVVGLVHGGARCHILTPARTLERLIDRLLERKPLTTT
jgi:hypothetical protein